MSRSIGLVRYCTTETGTWKNANCRIRPGSKGIEYHVTWQVDWNGRVWPGKGRRAKQNIGICQFEDLNDCVFTLGRQIGEEVRPHAGPPGRTATAVD